MVLTMRRVSVERLWRVLTKPGVVRVEGVPRGDMPGVCETVGVCRVLVGVPGGLVRSHGGADGVGHGGGAGVLVVRVVVPEEGLGVHTHTRPDHQTLSSCWRLTGVRPIRKIVMLRLEECLLPGPVRQGGVVGGVGGHVVPVRRDGGGLQEAGGVLTLVLGTVLTSTVHHHTEVSSHRGLGINT